MVADGTYTAVLDRFEGDEAVLVLESDGETAGQLVVESERLPADGRQQDALVTVTVRDDDLEEASYEPQRTEERKESAQSRFDRLSEGRDRGE